MRLAAYSCLMAKFLKILNTKVQKIDMNTIKHVLLKGNESFLDHTKSIALYGKLYWRKSNKKLNVGDIVYLFMSGKGHYQIRYKLEVTNTSVPRQDEECWLAPFVPDNDCFEFTPVAAMYEGEELGLNLYRNDRYQQTCSVCCSQ